MTVADRIVIVFAVVVLISLYLLLWTTGPHPTHAKLTDHDHHTISHNLDADRFIDVAGRLGTSKLEINRQRIRFVDSPCKSKVCIHAGWLEHSGQVLACLPNGVLVEMTGGTRQFDAINF